MAHVFISYSKKNYEYARKLTDHLIASGFDVWIDDRIDYGEDWWATIVNAIRACGALIVIMSPDSDESRWVQREITIADNLGKPIFPLLLAGDTETSKNWLIFVRTQYADVRDGTLPPERFLGRLDDYIERKATPGEEVAPKTPTAEVQPHGTSAPPKPTATPTLSRRFEAAMPSQIIGGAPTEVWAKISLPDSPGLKGELPAVVPSGDVIAKEDARATGFPFKFPLDPRTGQPRSVTVTLRPRSTALAFDEAEFPVELPPDADSQTVILNATLKDGISAGLRARVTLDLVYEARVIAQISVSGMVQAPMKAGVVAWALASAAIGEPPATMPDWLGDDEIMRGGGAIHLDDEEEDYDEAEPEAAFELDDEEVLTDHLPAPSPVAPPQTAPSPPSAATKSAPQLNTYALRLVATLALVFVVVILALPSLMRNNTNNTDPLTETGAAQIALTEAATATESAALTATARAAVNATARAAQTQTATVNRGQVNATARVAQTQTRSAAATQTATAMNDSVGSPARVGISSLLDGCSRAIPTELAARITAPAAIQLIDTQFENYAQTWELSDDYDVIFWGYCDSGIYRMRVSLIKPVAPPEIFGVDILEVSNRDSELDFFAALANALIAYVHGDFATAGGLLADVIRQTPHDEQTPPLYLLKGNAYVFAGQPADALSAYLAAANDGNLIAAAYNNRALAEQEILLSRGREEVEVYDETVSHESVLTRLETAHGTTSSASQQAVILTNIGLANIYFNRDAEAARSRCGDALNFDDEYLLAWACQIGASAIEVEEGDAFCPDQIAEVFAASEQAAARFGAAQPYALVDLLTAQIRLLASCNTRQTLADVAGLRRERDALLANQPIRLQTDQTE